MKFNLFKKPKVSLLHATPLEIAEIGARVCYDSFDKATDDTVASILDDGGMVDYNPDFTSPLVEKIVNIYHHGSISEHVNLNFYISNLSRGVLMELTRHRIASYSIRSTRYTMSRALGIIMLVKEGLLGMYDGKQILYGNNQDIRIKPLTVYKDAINNRRVTDRFFQDVIDRFITFDGLYDWLLTKPQKEIIEAVTGEIGQAEMPKEMIERFLSAPKKNAGDMFKDLVIDSWAVEAVVSFNLRSFKNFLKLRNSGAAWDPMRELAIAMRDATQKPYLDAIKA